MYVPPVRLHALHFQRVILRAAQRVDLINEVPALAALAVGHRARPHVAHDIVVQGEVCGEERVQVERRLGVLQECEERVVFGFVVHVEKQREYPDA